MKSIIGNKPAAAKAAAAPAAPAKPRAGRYKGMSDANASGERAYLRHGVYFVRVGSVTEFDSRNHEPMNAVQMDVLHVLDTPKGEHPDTGAEVLPNRAGEAVGHLFNFTKESALPNWKNFIQTAVGVTDLDMATLAAENGLDDVEDQWAATSRDVTGEEQPLSGVLLEVSCQIAKSKKTGNIFTKTTYRRRLSAQEVLDVMDEKLKLRLFGEGVLEAQAKEEAATA